MKTWIRPFLTASAALACNLNCVQAEPPPPVSVAAQPLTASQLTNVWLPDQVVPYAVGRSVDPRNRDIVHEAHTIFRREQTSRPNLAPPVALVLPTPGNPVAQDATMLLRDALTAELNEQRAASKTLIRQAESVSDLLRNLDARTKEFRDVVQEAARLRTQLQSLSNRLTTVECTITNAPPVGATE